jgi:Cys-rich repeat protein
MLFAEGTYDAIQIAVQGGASWVAINEVSLLTASCPAPDGGVFGADSGAQGEAGAQDASAQDGAISEAAAPADAAEDSPEASPCALSTVAATPFPSLSGSASVTGTEETPTGAGVISGCFALVGNPSSGTITFSITSTGCAFSYVDANGKTFTSALSGAATFDGDTYECEESQASFGSQLESICPELDGLENGVGGIVSLVVTRSTGAVSVSRSCSDSGVGSCPIGNYPSGNGVLTNDLDLTGFLSCADAGSGAGGGPQIHCGTTSCSATSQVCCFQLGDELAEAGTLCIDPSADCSPGVAIACSGPESCLPEEVCCTGIGLGNGLQAACQEGSTCPAGSNGEILCESNADCPAGGVCIAGPFYGQCGPCTTDSQCPNGNCADGFCVCTSDSQCVSGQLCNGSDICVSM